MFPSATVTPCATSARNRGPAVKVWKAAGPVPIVAPSPSPVAAQEVAHAPGAIWIFRPTPALNWSIAAA